MQTRMKKPLWIIIVLVLIVLVILGVTRKTPTSSTNPEFKIGAALPLTGPYPAFGEEFERGIHVAEDEINQNGGNLKVYVENTNLDAKGSVDAVTKLVNVDHVNALIVSAYLEAQTTHNISDAKGIPTLVLWDSNPQIEAMGDKVFAIGPWTPASGEVTARFIYNKGITRAAIFGFKQEWSNAVSEAFKNTFKDIGGVITEEEFANPGVKDYKSQLSKIVTSKPDAVYMTVEDFYVGLKELRELGYKGLVITSDVLDNELVGQQPTLFEGVFSSQVADPVLDSTTHFAELYKKKYGEAPKKILIGAWGYDGVQVVYKAHVEFPDLDMNKALHKLQAFNGASGEIKFDEHGSSKTLPKMFVVKGGKIVKVE
ncbi:MAG: amino acid transporter substrate-binding protein branched-chain amino acid transport system [Parcubacteria group bacterium]|nr:amino acid transporter substrate-binding protein branched-chain amino acid transport system [Parcubacteria group bacterium]